MPPMLSLDTWAVFGGWLSPLAGCFLPGTQRWSLRSLSVGPMHCTAWWGRAFFCPASRFGAVVVRRCLWSAWCHTASGWGSAMHSIDSSSHWPQGECAEAFDCRTSVHHGMGPVRASSANIDFGRGLQPAEPRLTRHHTHWELVTRSTHWS